MYILVKHYQNKYTFFPRKLKPDYDFRLDKYEKNLRRQINEQVTVEEYNLNVDYDHNINLIYFKNPNATNKNKDASAANKNKDANTTIKNKDAIANHLIIYAHGNGENIKSHRDMLYSFGHYADVILFDYSGYGKSTGEATTSGVCDDIHNVWLFATNVLGYKPKNIILYGFSLGGAVTSHLAHQLHSQEKELPKAIILQSTFTTAKKVAKQFIPRYLYNLTKFFMDNTFNTIDYLQSLNNKLKIMIVHSKEDEIIDYEHAKLLSKNINCDHIVINGDHNSGQLTEEFWSTFESYL